MTFNFTASTEQQADSETGKVIYQQFFYELVNYVNYWNCILFSSVESVLIIQQLGFLINICPYSVIFVIVVCQSWT